MGNFPGTVINLLLLDDDIQTGGDLLPDCVHGKAQPRKKSEGFQAIKSVPRT